MKVCFVSSYPPNRARLSEYAKNLVSELAKKKGISVKVLADRAQGRANRESTGEGTEIERIWVPRNPASILGTLFHIVKTDSDVVHFNVHFQSFGTDRLSNFVGLALIPLSRLLGMRTLVTIHNLGEKVNLSEVRVKPSSLNRIGIIVATRMILSASAVAVTVNSYVDHLRKRYKREVTYVPHGAPCTSSDPPNPSTAKTLLMFGHMSPYKGPNVLLEAFKKLVQERPSLRLIIAGSDHPKFPGYIESLAASEIKGVEVLGYVPEEELPRLFSTADLVVLPYLSATGTSGVFHLACGYGKPVVASDLPELREMVEEGATALLVRPNDAASLLQAIRRLLDDSELAREMGRKNAAYGRQETLDRVVEMYVGIYNALLSQKNG